MSNLSSLRFSQCFHNQPDLRRREATARIRETDGAEVFHQIGIIVYPKHQFLACGCRGDIRAIELGQLTFAISTDFHFLFQKYEKSASLPTISFSLSLPIAHHLFSSEQELPYAACRASPCTIFVLPKEDDTSCRGKTIRLPAEDHTSCRDRLYKCFVYCLTFKLYFL